MGYAPPARILPTNLGLPTLALFITAWFKAIDWTKIDVVSSGHGPNDLGIPATGGIGKVTDISSTTFMVAIQQGGEQEPNLLSEDNPS